MMGSEPISVLLVEDNQGDARLIEVALAGIAEPRFTVRVVDRLAVALELLAIGDTAIVLLDLSLPDSEGLDTVRRVVAAAQGVPIIVLTGHDAPGDGHEAIGAGAQDFLVKGTFDAENLGRAIRYAIERQRLARVVRQQAQRVNDLYNNAPVGYHSLGPDGLFLEINDTELDWYGYTRDEVIGKKRFTDITTPEGVRMFRELFPVFMEQGHIRDLEIEVIRKDGTTFPVLINSTTITDDEGNFLRSRSSAVNITQRKLAEDLMYQAKEEAERANRAKDAFLSRMSHELRTPLNAVLGFAQVLESEDLSREQLDSVRQIRKGGDHLLDLINEVLDISRISSGNLSLSPEPVSVEETLREVMELEQPLADDRGISLRLEDANGLHVLADRQRLKQVFLNLLANAIKYNREGGDVEVRWEKAGEGRLRISVSDSGPGIPPESMERLFEPFERLGAEGSGVEGTGLGLALSKALVEAMDGVLDVESEVGAGSRFSVQLPLAEPQMQRHERERRQVEAPKPGLEQIVLYVEDNLSNLRLVEKILERRPAIRLLSAMQGRLALDLARQHRPGLILLDLHLPDVPGEQVLRELRKDAATMGIPVVVISADATHSQIKQLLAAGANDYITKPIDVRRFLEIVDGTLGAG